MVGIGVGTAVLGSFIKNLAEILNEIKAFKDFRDSLGKPTNQQQGREPELEPIFQRLEKFHQDYQATINHIMTLHAQTQADQTHLLAQTQADQTDFIKMLLGMVGTQSHATQQYLQGEVDQAARDAQKRETFYQELVRDLFLHLITQGQTMLTPMAQSVGQAALLLRQDEVDLDALAPVIDDAQKSLDQSTQVLRALPAPTNVAAQHHDLAVQVRWAMMHDSADAFMLSPHGVTSVGDAVIILAFTPQTTKHLYTLVARGLDPAQTSIHAWRSQPAFNWQEPQQWRQQCAASAQQWQREPGRFVALQGQGMSQLAQRLQRPNLFA